LRDALEATERERIRLAEVKRKEELRQAEESLRLERERLALERERILLAEERQREEGRLAEERLRLERARLEDDRKRAEATKAPAAAPVPAAGSLQELADPSAYANRVALVIGNSGYAGRWALKNPENDARAMAAQFKALGFEVLLHLDVRVQQIGSILAATHQRLRPGGAFVVYYAGHGLQMRGENYFPAIDAMIQTPFDVPTQSIALQHLVSLADDAKSELRLLFLDACRDNPWMGASRSTAGGLARTDPPKGTLISFATRPGSVADDGTGANGIYTTHLLRHLNTPNLPVESVFKRVANDVFRVTNGRQEPWHEGNLRGEFAFVVKR